MGECISRGSSTPLPFAPAIPNFGVPFYLCVGPYTLCCRNNKFDVMTHDRSGVHRGVSHAPSQSHQSTLSATSASFSTVTCQWTLTSLGSSARVSEFWDKYAASAALSLPREALLTLVTSFITSKIDNFNVALAGLPQRDLDRIQSVLNAAAWLTADARKFDHVTPLIMNLHWLRLPNASSINFAFECTAAV